MSQSVADHDVAGMVTILVKDGDVAQFKAYGLAGGDRAMTQDSLFRIYSMSKPITGVAMMQLYEQGKWQLDDPVTKYAPELANLRELTWKDGKPVLDKSGKPVLATPQRAPTMRELMTHTAGFGYGLSGDDPVNKAFRDEAVLGSKDLDEMMQQGRRASLCSTSPARAGRIQWPSISRAIWCRNCRGRNSATT